MPAGSSFKIFADNKAALARVFGERGLDLSGYASRSARKRANNGLEEELYILRRYLFTLAEHNRLNYPIEIAKSETPDFVCSADNEFFGIEITEGTTAADQREMTLAERSKEISLLGSHGGRYRKGIRDGASGGRGRKADRDAVCDVIQAIRRKRGRRYTTATIDLIIYLNSNASLMAEFNSFLPLVAGRLDIWGDGLVAKSRIRSVAIILDLNLIIWSVFGGAIALDLRSTLQS